MEHTPGPWEVYNEGYFYPHLHIVKKEGHKQRNIAVIPRGMTEENQEEIKDNAQLIAAAPDMYEALKGIDEEIMCFEETIKQMEVASGDHKNMIKVLKKAIKAIEIEN